MSEQPIIPESSEVKESKFNLGLSTLECLHDCLESIKKISLHYVEYNMTIGEAQHKKFELCKYFYMRSAPLLSKGERKDMKAKLDKILIAWDTHTGFQYSYQDRFNKFPLNPKAMYLPKIDMQIDSFIVEIENLLQEGKKIFSKSKGEGSLL